MNCGALGKELSKESKSPPNAESEKPSKTVAEAGLERPLSIPTKTDNSKTGDAESDVNPAILRRLARAIDSLLTPAECRQLADHIRHQTEKPPKAQDS